MRRRHETKPLDLRCRLLYSWRSSRGERASLIASQGRASGQGRGFSLAAVLLLSAIMAAGCSSETRREQSGPSGEDLFRRHCAGCHPDGKNLIYPSKDLRRLTLAANGISQPEDIVTVLRNPGRGMTRFDRTVIPDDEARRIAAYVMAAFR